MAGAEETTPPEFMQYIKQRDAALESVKKTEAELRETQSKLYDSMQKVEELQKKIKEGETKSTKTGGAKKGTAVTASSKRRGSVPAIHSSSKNAGLAPNHTSDTGRRKSLVSSSRPDEGGLYHPHIEEIEPVLNSRDYYWKIAEKFPLLPMHQILEAEKKFLEVDVEGTGTITLRILDKVLSDTVGMLTDKQLEEIFKELDTDGKGVDFLKVLAALNKLVSRRKTNLPQSIQQNYAKICSIQ